MAIKKTRKQELNTILTTIDLPNLVLVINFNGVKYTPKDFPKLREIVLQELIVLDMIVNI